MLKDPELPLEPGDPVLLPEPVVPELSFGPDPNDPVLEDPVPDTSRPPIELISEELDVPLEPKPGESQFPTDSELDDCDPLPELVDPELPPNPGPIGPEPDDPESATPDPDPELPELPPEPEPGDPAKPPGPDDPEPEEPELPAEPVPEDPEICEDPVPVETPDDPELPDPAN